MAGLENVTYTRTSHKCSPGSALNCEQNVVKLVVLFGEKKGKLSTYPPKYEYKVLVVPWLWALFEFDSYAVRNGQ